MVEELDLLIDDFPGPANQTRCFLHILNLVVKSIIRQFDLPKTKKTSDDDEDEENDAEKEILKLADEIEWEEAMAGINGDEEDATEDDNDEGWVDEREEMTEGELRRLTRSVKPVRLLLSKVC